MTLAIAKRSAPSIRTSRIGFDLRDPLTTERAIAEIAAAFEAGKGSPTEAARVLEVEYKRLSEWVSMHPELERRLNTVRAKFGLPKLGAAGRPAAPKPRGKRAR